MGKKRQEFKDAVLYCLSAIACVLYVIVLVFWIRQSTGREVGRKRLPRRLKGEGGQDGSLDFAELFWEKHYGSAASVPWLLVSEDLIVETSGVAPNVTHGSTAVLAPFVDEDGDGFAAKDDIRRFLVRFGSHAPRLEAALDHAIRQAARQAEALRPSAGGGDANPHGCALSFQQEKKQYAELVNSGNLQFPGRQPFTLEAWVRPRRRNREMVIISKYNRGKWGQYILKVDSSGRVFFHREVAPWGQKSEARLPVGDFSHVAVVYDGSVSRIFVNGTLSREQKEGPQDNNPETLVLLGAMQENGRPAEFFDGDLDEIRMWDTARSPEELHHFMHVSLSGSEDGLVGLWSLDDCAGIKASDRQGRHDVVLRGPAWTASPLRMKSYQESFGCVDTMCG